MKAILRIAAFTIVALTLTARSGFALVHDWSHSYTGTSWQTFGNVALDASGNIYVAGSFYNSMNFGGGDRTSNGAYDILLVKFDPSGTYVWDKTFGDADLQFPTGLATDAAGNVVLAGTFQGSVNFGGGVLTSAGDRDLFVAKFDAAGTHLWSKRFGDAGAQNSAGVTVDVGNDLYFVGLLTGSVDFGGGPLTSLGGYDAFVVKLDPNGAHLWSKRFGDASFQSCDAVTTDHWGNVDLVINFNGTVNAGAGNVNSTAEDILLVQYGAAGNYQWADHFGGPADQVALAVAVEAFEGYPYITGYTTGAVDFGGGSITNAGGTDAFLAKFDCFGAHLWSHGFGDAANQVGMDLAVDALGDVYFSGYNEGTIHLGTAPLMSLGGRDIFIAHFSEAGGHLWSQGYGNIATDQTPGGLVVDGDYNVTMAGSFRGNVNFGGSTLSADEIDAFLVSFGPSTTDVRTPIRNTDALWAVPNPFNPLTVLHYSVREPSHVCVDIFDARGARVTTLVNRDLHAGTFTATWNGVDERGTPVSSGVYFARLTAGAVESRVKLVLLK